MQTHRVYRLAAGVQVRREQFGLLFYNYRGPRLYFVPSLDLLEADFFGGAGSASRQAEAVSARTGMPRETIEESLHGLLVRLEEKGLIHGQPLC